MSDHLPECARWFTDMPASDECPACEMFRSCERRVADEIWNAIHEGSQYKSGFEGGLDAARDAVAAELGWEDADASDDYKPHTAIWKFRALAAIDALRGEA